MVGYMAKFGGKEHLKDLAPFLTDAEDLGSSQLNAEPELFWQFRDSALAACVRLSGQRLGITGSKLLTNMASRATRPETRPSRSGRRGPRSMAGSNERVSRPSGQTC
jgi:hypothetical protein